MTKDKQRGGIAHILICLKSNIRQFEILGRFKDARRAKYVLRKVESDQVKNLDQYDAAWEEAKTKIK
jgi:hypothetical protein